MFTVFCYKPDLIGSSLKLFWQTLLNVLLFNCLSFLFWVRFSPPWLRCVYFDIFVLFLWFFFSLPVFDSRSTFTADVSAHLLPCRPSLSPQETRSGCQVRSSPRPPGTWSESLSASASPSASKVQTWQPCRSTPFGSPAKQNNTKKKAWITGWSQTPFGGWKSPTNQLGRVCSRTAWREKLEPEQFSLDLEFNTEKSPQVMILISVIDKKKKKNLTVGKLLCTGLCNTFFLIYLFILKCFVVSILNMRIHSFCMQLLSLLLVCTKPLRRHFISM